MSGLDLQPADAITWDGLCSIIAQVYESLLDCPVALAGSGAAAGSGGSVYTSSVTITGAWSARVTLTAPVPVAEQMTRRMLALPDAEPLDPADLADALGEVVNVIGGNLKALAPGDTRLGLPSAGPAPQSAAAHPDPLHEVAVHGPIGSAAVAVHLSAPTTEGTTP